MSLLRGLSFSRIIYVQKAFLAIAGKQNAWNISAVASKSSAVDLIDAFSFEILDKSKRRRESVKDSSFSWLNDAHTQIKGKTEKPRVEIEGLSNQQVSNLILVAVSEKDVEYLNGIVKHCCALNKSPSVRALTELFTLYSASGDVRTIKLLQELCESVNKQFCLMNAHFDHYLAKAQCLKGNIDKGMLLFLSVYEQNPLLRRSIGNMMREVVTDTVSKKSEASTVILRKNLEIVIRKWKDFYPMACFWRSLWLSEWFADQQLSEEIFDKYGPLRTMVTNKAPHMCLILLRQNNEDAVVRLLQTLLRHKLHIHYVKVLQVLFDHRSYNKDIRGCTEIIRNCKTLGLSMDDSYLERYIYMIIDKKGAYVPEASSVKTKLPVFKFKF